MMLRPIRTTGPAVTPVSVDEIKANSRIDHPDDDALIGRLLNAAIARLDGWGGIMGRCLINQVWTYSLANWPACHLELPFPDVSAVSVTYYDPAAAVQTLAPSYYRLLQGEVTGILEWSDAFAGPSRQVRSDAISISMTAGYGVAATDVPEDIRQAIILLVGHWYVNREASGPAMTELPFAVSALLAPHRLLEI